MLKSILLKHYDGGDIVGHYVYEEFESLQECYEYIMNEKIKEYKIYKLFEVK